MKNSGPMMLSYIVFCNKTKRYKYVGICNECFVLLQKTTPSRGPLTPRQLVALANKAKILLYLRQTAITANF